MPGGFCSSSATRRGAEGSTTQHIPASPGKAAGDVSPRPRIQRRQHSSFLHRGATFNTFSLSCCSPTLLSTSIRTAESEAVLVKGEFGRWFHVSYISIPPESIKYKILQEDPCKDWLFPWWAPTTYYIRCNKEPVRCLQTSNKVLSVNWHLS